MKILLGVLAVSILGAQAQALSCRRPNIAQSFNTFQESPERYRLMVGTVKMTGAIPKYEEGKLRSAPAEVTGRFVGRTALGALQTLTATVNTHCAGVWCGGFPQAMPKDVIIYLKQTPTGHVIDIHACPNGFGQQATSARIKGLQKCLRQGLCSEADVKRFERL